jgi:hypothetical protein
VRSKIPEFPGQSILWNKTWTKDMPEPEENPEEIQKKKDQNLQSLNKALRKQ